MALIFFFIPFVHEDTISVVFGNAISYPQKDSLLQHEKLALNSAKFAEGLDFFLNVLILLFSWKILPISIVSFLRKLAPAKRDFFRIGNWQGGEFRGKIADSSYINII